MVFNSANFCRALFLFFFTAQFLNAFVETRTFSRYALDIAVFFGAPVVAVAVFSIVYPKLYLVLRKELRVSLGGGIYAALIGLLLALTYLVASRYRHLFHPALFVQFGSSTLDGYAPNLFKSPGATFLMWGLLWILPSFAEEFFYRMVLIQSFQKPPSQLLYLILSAGLFATVHFEQGLLFVAMHTVFFNIPASVYYYQERKIGPLFIVHAVVNSVTSLGIFFF